MRVAACANQRAIPISLDKRDVRSAATTWTHDSRPRTPCTRRPDALRRGSEQGVAQDNRGLPRNSTPRIPRCAVAREPATHEIIHIEIVVEQCAAILVGDETCHLE